MKLPNRKGDGLSQTNLRPHFALSATYGAESVAAGLNLPRAGEDNSFLKVPPLGAKALTVPVT